MSSYSWREIPQGLCQCGCGGQTPISQCTNRSRGTVKGMPMRFVPGHQARLPLETAFCRRFTASDSSQCWEWQGALSVQGYGRFYYRGQNFQAHRVSYQLFVSAIPEGLGVCHSCDNRKCVNPNHLFAGTHLENMQDMSAKGRAHGPGLKGEDVPTAKLTARQVSEIRERLGNGAQRRLLAEEYGVARVTIDKIATRKLWSHLT